MQLSDAPLVHAYIGELCERLEEKSQPASKAQLVRIRRARQSIAAFCTTYLPDHFDKPFGEHHHDMFAIAESGDDSDSVLEREAREGKRIVRAEPRRHGKSAIWLIGIPLWWLAYRLKRFIVLYGASEEAVQGHFLSLQNAIDPTINPESLLLQDFPHLQPAMDFKGQFISWSDKKIRLESGATVTIRGLKSKFRGLKEDESRPDAQILDDPQELDDLLTEHRRKQLRNKFFRTIMNLGSHDCDIIVEGNLMHKQSLIADLLRDKMWDGKLYKAENLPPRAGDEFPYGNTQSDGSPLWPAMWPKDRLDLERRRIRRMYAIEFLNEDRGSDDRIYDSSEFMRWDDAKVKLNLSGFDVIAVWDPATGDAKDPDYGAVMVMATKIISVPTLEGWLKQVANADMLDLLAFPRDGEYRFYWVLDIYLERSVPGKQCRACLDFLEKYPIRRVYYEDNGAFRSLIPQFHRMAKARRLALPLMRFSQNRNKVQRIMNAHTVVTQKCFFERSLNPLLLSQFDDFGVPHAHDDGPDAVVCGIERYERVGGRTVGF